jgi:hypothetical protein
VQTQLPRVSNHIVSLASATGLILCAAAAAGDFADTGRPAAQGGAASSTGALSCDESLKTRFRPDANTTVTLVHAFTKGADLNLDGKPSGKFAANDLCLVKLNVGPGNPGPAEAPSTSRGIGIEIWLPAAGNWNRRVHVLGGGGYVGLPQISSITQIGLAGGPVQAVDIAGVEGSVSAVTDAGHVSHLAAPNGDVSVVPMMDGSFAMLPDGGINKALWKDFANRGIHEMAVKAKQLATAYYGRRPRYAYWDGCSTGGRQALMEAQEHPEDFDGILAGAPAINWTRFITGGLYPQIVMQRDLGGVPLTLEQLNLVSSAAVSACDADLNGQHEGYITNPRTCRYDPAGDHSVSCNANGGLNTSSACVTAIQARAINKIWYGQTGDGSVPDPAVANGYSETLGRGQLWFGVPRGTTLGGGFSLASSANGVPMPFPITTDQVALILGKPTLSIPTFHNQSGDGANGWTTLTYEDLAHASAEGVAKQPAFANINTDDPDLTAFRKRNGKLIHYHGMADQLIPAQGSDHYYARVAARMGGYTGIEKFYRYYPIPAMGHCFGVGSVNGMQGVSPAAEPPLPAPKQLFNALVDWVEKGQAPDKLTLTNSSKSLSRPLCAFPKKVKYVGQDRSSADSYTCE